MQYLRKHGLSILCHHGALIAIQRHKVVVKGLLGMLQDIKELCGSPFKDTPEVSGNQCPTNSCWRKRISCFPFSQPVQLAKMCR